MKIFAKVYYNNIVKKILLNDQDLTFDCLSNKLAKTFNISNPHDIKITYLDSQGLEVVINNTGGLKTAITQVQPKDTLKLKLESRDFSLILSSIHFLDTSHISQNPIIQSKQEKNVNVPFRELESMLDEIFSDAKITEKLSQRLEALCLKSYVIDSTGSLADFKVKTDTQLLSQYFVNKLTDLATQQLINNTLSKSHEQEFARFNNQLSSHEKNDPLFSVADMKCEYLDDPLGIDSPNPRFTWSMQDTRLNARQTSYRLIVGTDQKSVQAGTGDMWDTNWVDSDTRLIIYNGKALQPFTQYFWRVDIADKDKQKSNDPTKTKTFETGLMDMKNWQGQWITDIEDISVRPAGYFRKVFQTQNSKTVKSARAYVAVGGLFELSVNGQKISDQILNPMYTRFDRRTLYVTLDVTSQVKSDQNALGVILGNGWYNFQPVAVWGFETAPWRKRPRFCLNLRLVYQDGTTEVISTNTNDWKATSNGPIVSNNIYTGEHYDMTKEMPGWNTTNFDDSNWSTPLQGSAPSDNIVSQVLQPIRYVEEVPAKNLTKFSDTNYIYDLGRNIAGVCKFTVKGDKGTTIKLIHSEIVDSKGHADQSNIASLYHPVDDSDPFQTDIYILSGADDSFMPRFNYKGFQYIEIVSDKPITLALENLTAYFQHSDAPVQGQIKTSNPLIDKIWWCTNNSYLSNLQGYLTDCPQREKNGWTGDAHTAIETGLYSFDSITIYEKWLADHRDEQQPTGVLPAIIPTCGWGYTWANGVDWTSTIAVIPWTVYLFYGDSKLLSDCYTNIKMYVDYIDKNYPTGITDWGLGDWVPIKSVTPVPFTSTCYYFRDVNILTSAAKLLGKQDDETKYSTLAAKIKDAFNSKYLNTSTGMYDVGYQTELSAALYWGLVPDNLKGKVAQNLATAVAAADNHLDVGLLGTKSILSALSQNGYADLAYTVATQETFPSWGFWLANGATTLFENWPLTAKDITVSSRNHIMFGEIGAWFYKALAGINPDPDQPGFKNVILSPHFVGSLDQFEGTHDGPYGTIVSSWQRKDNVIDYKIIVPPNSTATLQLPKVEGKKVYLKGKDHNQKMLLRETSGLQLKAGTYEFTWI